MNRAVGYLASDAFTSSTHVMNESVDESVRYIYASVCLFVSNWDREPNGAVMAFNQNCAVMGIDGKFLDNDCRYAQAGTICEEDWSKLSTSALLPFYLRMTSRETTNKLH